MEGNCGPEGAQSASRTGKRLWRAGMPSGQQREGAWSETTDQQSSKPSTEGKGRGSLGASAIKPLLTLGYKTVACTRQKQSQVAMLSPEFKKKILVTRERQSVPSLPSWSCLRNLLSSGSGPARKPIPKGPLACAPDLAKGLCLASVWPSCNSTPDPLLLVSLLSLGV